MKISPRKAETTAVVELLKNGDFETPEQAAAAIVRLVSELLGERSFRLCAHRLSPQSQPIFFGPFPTTKAVAKFADSMRLPGEHAVRWIHSPKAALVGAQTADWGPPRFCLDCDHPLAAHGVLPTRKEACTIKGCHCVAPVSGKPGGLW